MNTPLNHEQIKALPKGFNPTSDGINRQQRRLSKRTILRLINGVVKEIRIPNSTKLVKCSLNVPLVIRGHKFNGNYCK